jgi:diguanylate cyclase (GGDEF)-like protein/PAS domain S-box-containing protein
MRDDGPALRALRSGVRAGVNIGVAPADGVLRMLSFERVGGTRLVVGIGQSLDEHLAGWRREASVYGTVTALFGVLALCMLWRGAWHARRLQRSEALTRSILAQAPDAFISMDHRGRITDWNAQAEATFGWRRGEVLGRTVAELLVPPRLREQHEAGLRDFVRSGTGAVINRRLRMPALHRRGHEIPVELSIAAVRNGDVFTANAFLHDVTLLEDAERARAVEERRTRTITDNLPVLISYIDKEHRLLFCNATYKDWLGLEPAEAVGRPLLQAIGPTLYEQCRAHLERALAGERVDFELQSQARGVTRHLQNVYIPDVDADGNVAGIYTLSTDVTALKSVERRLSQLAHVDALTGLPNRRQFEQMLQLSLARCQRGDRPFALAFLDLDHFKPINDKHGHATGDAVLREVAARLHNCVRQTDAVGRLAGDEFVVILAGVHSSEQADRAARKIAGCFAEPVVVGPLTLQVSCSIGLALFAGEDITPGEAMSRADQALYRAKREGRSKFAMFA